MSDGEGRRLNRQRLCNIREAMPHVLDVISQPDLIIEGNVHQIIGKPPMLRRAAAVVIRRTTLASQ